MILPIAIAAAALTSTLADIGWLAGDWQTVRGNQCIEEHWSAPSANMLVAVSRTVQEGATRSFEFLRIESRADGIFYVAQPGGRPPVDFKLSGDVGHELIFVNPGHADHLKRIVYTRRSADELLARVEGEEQGRPFAIEYPYRRVSPAAAACSQSK